MKLGGALARPNMDSHRSRTALERLAPPHVAVRPGQVRHVNQDRFPVLVEFREPAVALEYYGFGDLELDAVQFHWPFRRHKGLGTRHRPADALVAQSQIVPFWERIVERHDCRQSVLGPILPGARVGGRRGCPGRGTRKRRLFAVPSRRSTGANRRPSSRCNTSRGTTR